MQPQLINLIEHAHPYQIFQATSQICGAISQIARTGKGIFKTPPPPSLF